MPPRASSEEKQQWRPKGIRTVPHPSLKHRVGNAVFNYLIQHIPLIRDPSPGAVSSPTGKGHPLATYSLVLFFSLFPPSPK